MESNGKYVTRAGEKVSILTFNTIVNSETGQPFHWPDCLGRARDEWTTRVLSIDPPGLSLAVLVLHPQQCILPTPG